LVGCAEQQLDENLGTRSRLSEIAEAIEQNLPSAHRESFGSPRNQSLPTGTTGERGYQQNLPIFLILPSPHSFYVGQNIEVVVNKVEIEGFFPSE